MRESGKRGRRGDSEREEEDESCLRVREWGGREAEGETEGRERGKLGEGEREGECLCMTGGAGVIVYDGEKESDFLCMVGVGGAKKESGFMCKFFLGVCMLGYMRQTNNFMSTCDSSSYKCTLWLFVALRLP